MNNGPLLFFGLLFSLACSFWGLILAPQLQIGRQQSVVIAATGQFYPQPRPGLAQQGVEVYRSLGCAECHSQQVHQRGVTFELWLADAGTNSSSLLAMITQMGVPSTEAPKLIAQAPVKLLGNLNLPAAQAMAGQLTNDEARAVAVIKTLGPDIERGWGKRVTVAQDYLGDYPVQIGRLRLGPDLADYGSRYPAESLVMLHLYEAQRTMPGSMMPPYRFLFTKGKLAAGQPKPEKAVLLPNGNGEFIVPKPKATALAAYLHSLQVDTALPEAPVPAPPAKPAPAPAQAPTP